MYTFYIQVHNTRIKKNFLCTQAEIAMSKERKFRLAVYYQIILPKKYQRLIKYIKIQNKYVEGESDIIKRMAVNH